jgi:DNA-directed RNA polymerase I, II, and III subunit RPABC1
MSRLDDYNYDTVEALFKSLTTATEMLETRGFVVDSVPKFSPVEIRSALNSVLTTLNFKVPKRDNAEYTAEVRFQNLTRTSGYDNIQSDLEENGTNRELIYIMTEQVQPWHHQIVRKVWSQSKVLVSIFCCFYISTNPTKHILVPKHEVVSKDTSVQILKDIHAKKSQLPIIVYHEDVQGRYLGLRPGEIVKITRPSPSSGFYTVYRICV